MAPFTASLTRLASSETNLYGHFFIQDNMIDQTGPFGAGNRLAITECPTQPIEVGKELLSSFTRCAGIRPPQCVSLLRDITPDNIEDGNSLPTLMPFSST